MSAVTQWFQYEDRPVHIGVYEMRPAHRGTFTFPYFYWDGDDWFNCDLTVSECFISYTRDRIRAISSIGCEWRGVAERAK